jgi:hypothetical protein
MAPDGMGEGPLKELHNLASFCQKCLTTHSCMPRTVHSARKEVVGPTPAFVPFLLNQSAAAFRNLQHIVQSAKLSASARPVAVQAGRRRC